MKLFIKNIVFTDEFFEILRKTLSRQITYLEDLIKKVFRFEVTKSSEIIKQNTYKFENTEIGIIKK